MVPKGGSEAKAPDKNLVVIPFLLANLLAERRHKWKQINIPPI